MPRWGWSGRLRGFDPSALPVFAMTEEIRRCAEEFIAMLQRYGVKAEFRLEA